MRSFVALGIAVVTLVLLAGKLTHHHRRVGPPPEPADVEAVPVPVPNRQTSPQERRAWSGPTLRELLDKTSKTAVIRGHVRGPDGTRINVRASPAGTRERGRWIRVENGAFEIPGLVSGRAYDLTFTGLNLRQATLRSVTAPADDVEARLDRLPILRGAIGFPLGGACAYDQVTLRTGTSEPEDVVAIGLDATCRFELTVPDGPAQMVVVATGDGPRLEVPLAMPAAGDPAPICLDPPCQADPLAGTARLRISFADGQDTDLSANVASAGGDGSKSYGCVASDDACELTALPVNRLFNLTAESADCARTDRTIVLHAGDNDLSLPCEPAQAAQAATGDAGGDDVEEEFAVQ